MKRNDPIARGRRAGFTLAELLVVLALISLVAGIAVPTIVRIASQNRNALRDTAIDLQEMLRATKVLAQTRRLETAVVYLIAAELVPSVEVTTNYTSYVDGVAGARQLSAEELSLAGFRNQAELNDVIGQKFGVTINSRFRVFIPIPIRGDEVRPLRGEGALYDPETAAYAELAGNPWLNSEARANIERDMGVIPVYLLDRTAFINPDPGAAKEDRVVLLEPRTFTPDPGGATLDLSFGNPYAFPAHVFRPNGVLLTNSDKQRFELIVAARPSADPAEQWQDPFGENPAFQGDRKRLHYRIELYAALGRVRLGTELVAGFDS